MSDAGHMIREYLVALAQRRPLDTRTGRVNHAILSRLQEDDLPKICEIIERLSKVAYDALGKLDDELDQEAVAKELVMVEELIVQSDLARWGDTEGH